MSLPLHPHLSLFRPVETITRLAAYTLARSLRKAGLPVVLVTTGEGPGRRETIQELEHTADLLDIWTLRTLKPANLSQILGELIG